MAERHARQERFTPIGVTGQQRIAAARVLVVGVGALGSSIAEQLARAGVGTGPGGWLRLVDRDVVEATNLQRQCLYDQADADAGAPKAAAAAQRLAAIDRSLSVEPVVGEVTAATIGGLLADCDLVCDGCDNFATRHVINEACCRAGIPWIYAACVGAYACCLPIEPGVSACLRCLQDELPEAGDGPTCDTAGIIAPAVHQAASWSVTAALQRLVGGAEAWAAPRLQAADLWAGTHQQLRLGGFRDPACRACSPTADYPALTAENEAVVVLCGRNGVQLRRQRGADLDAATAALGDAVETSNPFLVRWRGDHHRGTLFADGRVIVEGTEDPVAARTFCDRWLG